ncbi:unknown [Firmicutes bacterium CAG:56]|nr:unknown [Firmicutes bacterium CAG:56]
MTIYGCDRAAGCAYNISKRLVCCILYVQVCIQINLLLFLQVDVEYFLICCQLEVLLNLYCKGYIIAVFCSCCNHCVSCGNALYNAVCDGCCGRIIYCPDHICDVSVFNLNIIIQICLIGLTLEDLNRLLSRCFMSYLDWLRSCCIHYMESKGYYLIIQGCLHIYGSSLCKRYLTIRNGSDIRAGGCACNTCQCRSVICICKLQVSIQINRFLLLQVDIELCLACRQLNLLLNRYREGDMIAVCCVSCHNCVACGNSGNNTVCHSCYGRIIYAPHNI